MSSKNIDEVQVRVAEIACGAEYSGIQSELEDAAKQVNAVMVYPEIELDDIDAAVKKFGLDVSSPNLRLMMIKPIHVVEGSKRVDAVFVATCFRCAEAAIVRNEIRRYIHQNSDLPVISYSFTEKTKAATLLTRMEALTTTSPVSYTHLTLP